MLVMMTEQEAGFIWVQPHYYGQGGKGGGGGEYMHCTH